MIKSLYNAETFNEVISRINQLTPESKALWGKMNVNQVLKHMTLGLKTATSELHIPVGLPGKLFGWAMKKFFYNDKPFSKNSPTAKELVVIDTLEFTKEKETLINYINKFHTNGPEKCTKAPHTFFGKLTPEQWGIGMYKHLDHHLRQFGV